MIVVRSLLLISLWIIVLNCVLLANILMNIMTRSYKKWQMGASTQGKCLCNESTVNLIINDLLFHHWIINCLFDVELYYKLHKIPLYFSFFYGITKSYRYTTAARFTFFDIGTVTLILFTPKQTPSRRPLLSIHESLSIWRGGGGGQRHSTIMTLPV